MPRKRKEEVTIEPGKGLNLDPELIKQLVPGTLDRATINEQLAALKKAIFERALGGELTHHLGYEKGEAKPAGRTNHRNGTSRKRITTDDDLLDVEMPRDREGTFDPVLIAKGERRFTGFDDKIIAMYARGMSVREIQGFLLEMYGIEVSPDFISTVTDAVIDEVREWQQRPLEPMYPVVFFDALRVKIRDEGVVRNKAIYLALGVRRDGTRDVLGLWIEQTEGAKFWLRVVNDLKLRGVQDILIAVVDGLKGFPEAICKRRCKTDPPAEVSLTHLGEDGGFLPPMLTQEQAVEIKVLARRGTAVREIARQTGLSRNTVRRYLRDGQAARYKQREPRPTKLDPFRDYLLERIAAARPHWIPATVLLRELQDGGYDGGISQLKAFLAPYKRHEAKPVVRFETPPGKQVQADFTGIRRGRAPLLALVATLGYSRSSFVRFTAGEDAATLCECLREAFVYFGGTPEQVLFDNAKSVIIERDAFGEGEHRWNAQLLAVAETYGFTPKVCQPYRAKTKGKVERFNRYLKESFVVPLAATLKQSGLKLDVEAANARIGRWLAEVANVRVRATTRERPAARLALEQAALLPLPTPTSAPGPAPSKLGRVLPRESLQHPLAVYDALLEVAA